MKQDLPLPLPRPSLLASTALALLLCAAPLCAEALLGDGISLSGGRKTEQVEDLSLPMLGGSSLSFTRVYSGDGGMGSFGVGWKSVLLDVELIPKDPETPFARVKTTPNLTVASGPVKDPCPNEPKASRSASFTVPGGPGLAYHFEDCQWSLLKTIGGILLRQAGQADALFEPAEGGYKPPAGRTETLTGGSSGGYDLRSQDGTVLHFEQGSSGPAIVTQRRDRNGNAIDFSYVPLSGGKRRVDVTGPGGRGLKVTYGDRGMIESVEDPLGQQQHYYYNAVSQLVRVEGPGPDHDDGTGYVATYDYDLLGRMTQKDDAKSLGLKTATYTYAATGQVAEVRDGLGRLRQQFTWDGGSKVTYSLGQGQSYVLSLDTLGRVTRMQSSGGLVDERDYDDAGDMLQRRLKPGDGSAARTLSYAYDSYRNLTMAVDAEGQVERWTYASVLPGCGCDRFATSHSDKRGYTSTRSFDSAGNLTATTDAAGNVSLYVYDSQGLRQSSQAPRGGLSTYDYNALGDLTGVHGPAGDVAYEVDALGRVTAVTDEQGHRTAYRLDGFGNALTVTFADQSFVESHYSPHGQLSSRSLQTAQGQSPAGSVQYQYDSADQLVQRTDAEGQVTGYGYDADGHPVRVTDPNAAAFLTDYDALGRVSGSRDPLGQQTLFKLDAYGDRLALIDANGNATRYQYDKLDRLRFITDANSHSIEFRYDEDGNRRYMVDANHHQTEWRYDARGLLTDEIDAKGVTVKHYSYDADGNVQTLTDGNGTVTTYGYDLAGRLQSEAPSVGSGYSYRYGSPSQPDKGYDLWQVTDPRGVESFLYDPLERVLSQTKPTGEVLAHQYDARGNRIRTDLNFRPGSGQAPLYQTWTYDKSDRNTQARDLTGGLKTLSYDPASRLVGESLPGRVKSEYQYDAANRLLDLRNLDGAGSLLARSKYSLDAVGNRMSKETVSDKESYSYDKTYQLTGVRTQWADLEVQAAADPTLKLTDGVTKTVAVTYDPMGNRQSYDETYTGGVPALHKAYSHDDANEMTSDGGVSQTYDDNGNLTGRGSETLGWDARNRLVSDHEAGKDDWAGLYDFQNRLASRTLGVSSTTMVYDDKGRLFAEIEEATGKPLELYSYDAVGVYAQGKVQVNGSVRMSYLLFDGLGSNVGTTDKAGRDQAHFDYGAFGEEQFARADDLTPFRYTGRWGGYTDNRLSMVINWNRGYDPRTGRWGSRDPIGVIAGNNLYAYVSNNALTYTDPLGLYWFRQPWQPIGVVGRPGTPVEPGGFISRLFEEDIPAGYTFGSNHDAFVGAATGAGFPDVLVNIPSMPLAYAASVLEEVGKSIAKLFDWQERSLLKNEGCK